MASNSRTQTLRTKRSPWVRRAKIGLSLLAIILLFGSSIVGFLYIDAYNKAKEAMLDLQKHIDSVNRPTSKILSADGEVLFRVSSEYRIPLKLSQIPKTVRNAVLAAEDKRFYQHSGVDMTSLARILYVAARRQRVSQGGSTITMQLVKLLFNGSAKSIGRKMNDLAYATALEQNLPKDQILELYLNKVYFGEGAFGIGEAAKVYFSKNVDELSLGEAALLARCIRLPSRENPIRDYKKALENRDVVLGILLEEGWITQDQYEKALQEKPHVNPKPAGDGIYIKPGAEYFVKHVEALLEKEGLDLINGGFTVETSLDYKLQRFAESAVKEIVRENRHQKVNYGAFMVMDSDGRILAEVGGLNYRQHQFNVITQGTLQPGSGFKAILYATALRAGVINMNSMLSNAPIHKVDDLGNEWNPGNASRNENRPAYSLRSAFAQSINLPAIHTIEELGPQAVVESARDCFGIHSKLDPYETLALGASAVSPMEMAEAYSVFMLRGDRVHPQPIVRILDADGVLFKIYEPARYAGVFDPGVCDQMDQLLRAVVEEGTGTAALSVPNARGKTGTTNAAKDAWFTGYTDGILGVGWVGNMQTDSKGRWAPVPMADSVYGGTVTAKLWARIMGEAHRKYGKAQADRSVPTEVKEAAPSLQQSDVDELVNSGDGTTDEDTKKTDDKGMDAAPVNGKPVDTSAVAPPNDPASATEGKSDDVDKTKKKSEEPPAEQTETKPPKRTRKTPVKDDSDTESSTVSVDICAESGQKANRYCPETVTRTFQKGKEPRRTCRIHGPGN